MQALLVTGVGGLCLFAGFLLLGSLVQSFNIIDAFRYKAEIQSHVFYLPILILVLLGAFTKSAQVPFHFWLPNAMEAPTPVSAYLHSATMVNAGIYLLARFSPLLGGTEIWHNLLVGFGLATMFIGAYQAFLKTGLKQILAYSTISILGFLTLLIGIGSEISVQAAMAFLLAHALSKAALFLVAGAIDRGAGTKDVTILSGLRHSMPFIAVAAFLAMLTKIGVPPFFGYYGKELAYEAVFHIKGVGPFLIPIVVLSNMFLVAAILCVGYKPFRGQKVKLPREPHPSNLSLWIGPIILGSMGFLCGIWPNAVENILLSGASASVIGHIEYLYLKIWHGWGLLSLSLTALGGGICLYRFRIPLRKLGAKVNLFHFKQLYHWKLALLHHVAKKITSFLQSGYLRHYLIITFVSIVAVIVYRQATAHTFSFAIDLTAINFFEAAICIVIVAASLIAMCVPSFITGIMAMGIVGFGIGTLFIFFGAPDLAITQFIIETLTLILFMTILARFPKATRLSTKPVLIRDAVIAFGFGGMMTTLVLIANSIHPDKEVSRYFVENSLSQAHGRNIVNVILVDFRGLDTLGEITVLAIAGLAVYALIKLKPHKE